MDIKINKINNFINNNNLPNLLLYGPYLNGKEELCNYFINKLNYKNKDKYILNINCLTTSGIKLIKEHIKLFSMQIIQKNTNINFKIIILRFCEYLTYDSQYSLRRTIEQFSHNTKFILLCEDKNKLLLPIISRFVHIYVNTNKHSTFYCLDSFKYNIFNNLMEKYYSICNQSECLIDLFNISKEFYKYFFAYELLYKFKNNINYFNIKLIFYNLSKNLRNELLIIFYLLNIFRNNSKLLICDLY